MALDCQYEENKLGLVIKPAGGGTEDKKSFVEPPQTFEDK